MILEYRKYTLKVGSVPKVEDLFAKPMPARTKVSPVAGFFHTEIGQLNQIHMLWPYPTLAERERCRGTKVEGWPPPIGEFVVEQDVRLFNAAPFSPKAEPRKYGELYEVRLYTYQAGSIPHVIEAWGTKIEERQKYSPLAFAGFSETGTLHQWLHIWAYKDWNERAHIRHEVHTTGVWPPKSNPAAVLLRQQNALVAPAAFSPWH